ncbi:CheR family methyltransferase [Alicyclobacillus dauci]|uniref:protein-glutamate O-methyltransferase n=1 Tax=Alicyclobacillus dauci TaxID=1475485 RepID=A0ABY6Z1L1_9BACL|nr:protein-glutamate O-methyltransferase CheR [Alicyclobacillus dauci]WAH36478.1 protein-glutamate O-methyltransferase CheR [Alicyclobacillus dauci]
MGLDSSADFDLFIQKLKVKTGLNLELYKRPQMERRLNSLRINKGFRSFAEFYNALCQTSGLFLELIDKLTINVTEFYRNAERWDVLSSKVLPELLARTSRLKVWSAACSTGEEPYTLALTLGRFLNLTDISICATDLDQVVLEKARRGRYTQESVKAVPRDRLDTYFRLEQGQYVVREELKKCIKFYQHNLLADKYESGYDLITCRNVMIYFTEEAKEQIFIKFHEALKPGGYLFVGAAEQIMSPSKYGFVSTDTFFYKKL